MSAVSNEQHEPEGPPGSSQEIVLAGQPVVVRRNAGLAAVVGVAAAAIAIAYLSRAVGSAAPLDWSLFVVMGLVAAYYLAEVVDARTPLVVADDLGVRIRLGGQWRGMPWDAVRQIVVAPRRGPLRDGRLVFLPRNPGRALDGLEPRGRRHALLNQKAYGAELAVPLGLTTRVSAGGAAGLPGQLAALVEGRVPLLVTAPASAPPDADPTPERPAVRPPRPPLQRRLVGGLGTVVSRAAKGRQHPPGTPPAPSATPAPAATAQPLTGLAGVPATGSIAPLRVTRKALRAQVTRDEPASTLGAAALEQDPAPRLPEGRALRRPGSVDLVFEAVDVSVRPISRLGDPVEPLVIDDFQTEPALDPVIGPELAAARTRVGLSVDELADRTRIRPHVIESIEVDDFAPCGGDFYARGHLRTLARVLGQDPEPLVAHFDARYAAAPINARRVFEAELATGMTGSMRATMGGPRWGLLVGAVLLFALVWGIVRLFATEPAELLRPAPIVLNGSAGVGGAFPGVAHVAPVHPRVSFTLHASGPTHVVVRNDAGKVVYTHDLVAGETARLRVRPPVTVTASDGGQVAATIAGANRGKVGAAGHHARRTFHRPANG